MHKNEKILRDQDAALEEGDLDGFFAAFADDVIIHVGGRSKLAGDVKGKAELQTKFNDFMAALGDNPEIATHDILANDEHGVVLQTYRGSKKGKILETNGVAIFNFTKGKISEGWFFDENPYTADAYYDA